MVNYGEAIKRPFSDWKKLIIGILLSILPIINFFAGGYELNCGKSVLKKKKDYKLPKWTNWGSLFVQGFLLFVIGFIYMIPALIAFALTAGTALLSMFESIVVGDLSVLSGLMGGIMVAVILTIIAAYLLPAAALGYASGRFGDAFKLGTVFRKAFTGVYFVGFLASLGIYLIIALISSWIPLFGGAIASFIGGVIWFTIMGEAYSLVK